MDENTEVEFEGKKYIWDGRNWCDARTYMVPPDGVVARLDMQFRAHEVTTSPSPRARAPRKGATPRSRPEDFKPAPVRLQPPPPPPPVEKLTAFEGPYAFLMNEAPAPVFYEGEVHPSVTAAFDGAYARHLRLRPGMQREWDEVLRVPLMRKLLRSKFAGPELRKALLDTGDKHLSHQAPDADPFWNRPGGDGENTLGRLLMDLRAQIRKHYCLLSDDQIVEHLRETTPQNPLVPDDALVKDCCWKRVSELAELYKDELGPDLLPSLKDRKQKLAPNPG